VARFIVDHRKGIHAMKMDTVDAWSEQELRDMYDAEKRLTKALPKAAKAANSEELKTAFQEHLEVTKNQVTRLEEVFRLCDLKPRAKQCAGMVGILEEAEEIIGSDGEEPITDLALAAAARKVENYEITAYKTLQMLAENMGNQQVQDLIQESLSEEEETDQQLADLCTQLLESASQGSEAEDEEDEEMMETEEEDEPVTTGSRRR
jgi:ferritin-like metal-binding protein YciE